MMLQLVVNPPPAMTQKLFAAAGLSLQWRTRVVFKNTDGILVPIDFAGAFVEGYCIHVSCIKGAVHTLHELSHACPKAPMAVEVHRVGLGEVPTTVSCTQNTTRCRQSTPRCQVLTESTKVCIQADKRCPVWSA